MGDLPRATTCPAIAPWCALEALQSATTYRVMEEDIESIEKGKCEETRSSEEERNECDMKGQLSRRWRSPGRSPDRDSESGAVNEKENCAGSGLIMDANIECNVADAESVCLQCGQAGHWWREIPQCGAPIMRIRK